MSKFSHYVCIITIERSRSSIIHLLWCQQKDTLKTAFSIIYFVTDYFIIFRFLFFISSSTNDFPRNFVEMMPMKQYDYYEEPLLTCIHSYCADIDVKTNDFNILHRESLWLFTTYIQSLRHSIFLMH